MWMQLPSPVKLEDLASDMPISASSKAKAKQAVQSRAFQVPPVGALCHIGLATNCVFFCFETRRFLLLPLRFLEFKHPTLSSFRSHRVWLMCSMSLTSLETLGPAIDGPKNRKRYSVSADKYEAAFVPNNGAKATAWRAPCRQGIE